MRRNLGENARQAAVWRMEDYFHSVLERPVAAFANKPPCPFSRRERDDDRIRYEFCEILPSGPAEDVVELLKEFSLSRRHTTLLVIDPDQRVTVAEGVEYGRELSRRCRDERIIAISVHPDDDFAIDGFQTRRGIPYVTMICQAAEYLKQAKQQLAGTDYYSKWTQAALEYNFQQIGEFF